MTSTPAEVALREVTDDDLPIFFEQQRDPTANQMAAFGAANPDDRDAFEERWRRIRGDSGTTVRTILADGRVAGHIFAWRDEGLPAREVTYWIGGEYWGRGIATAALATFLEHHATERPLYGRAARQNVGSLRVLEKCGFHQIGVESGENARGETIAEVILELR